MVFDLRANGRGGGQRAQLGFRIDGPVALAEGDGLPVAKLRCSTTDRRSEVTGPTASLRRKVSVPRPATG